MLIIIFISGTTHIFYIYFNYLKVSAEVDVLKSRQLAIIKKKLKLDTLNQNMTHLQSKVEELTRELDKLQSAKSSAKQPQIKFKQSYYMTSLYL